MPEQYNPAQLAEINQLLQQSIARAHDVAKINEWGQRDFGQKDWAKVMEDPKIDERVLDRARAAGADAHRVIMDAHQKSRPDWRSDQATDAEFNKGFNKMMAERRKRL
jgi:hypothetical protein